jgi:GH3 auxin-responsive promoter
LLGDQIQVTGHIHQCPLVRFIGRQDSVSDWFGEKLNDAHVSRIFEQTFKRLSISPSFAMLACDTAAPPRYVLYIDADIDDDLLLRAADAIDTGLRENFHYDYARRLGQLECVRAIRVVDGAKTFFDRAVRDGQRLGDIKVPALDRRCARSGNFRSVMD